ncbi:YbaK/EbsC family protein [Magnetovibrio sp.]|uniref:YbaK/EbsC family protein n=1 Tax=Magnetovibrio sp. TaxID=2024836 RepID=UPI002F9347AD
MSNLELETVKRVRKALADVGRADAVIELADSARTAAEAAQALGVEQGAIAKTLVFTVGNRYVVALVAGDHQCNEEQLPKVFHLQGDVVKPSADLVRAVTGFSIGGVSPVGQVSKLPTAIDASLKRFDKIYAAAGHPHCVFETSVDELKTLTNGLVSYAVGKAANPS